MAAHPNARLEAFSDGVFAIALTLLIIELKPPHGPEIGSNADLWRALGNLWPQVFAFLLSFGIIFITWVNHHNALKMAERTSMPFVYGNGVLLLSVVIMPFTTALLGDGLASGHASPAVVLYSANHVLQGFGWTLVSRTSYRPVPLSSHPALVATAAEAERYSYFAMAFYTMCAIAAVWLPYVIAAVITGIWIFWLIYGLRLKAPSLSA